MPADRLPGALRFTDAAIATLALWTLCTNACVAAGQGLDAAIGLFTIAAIAAAIAARRLGDDREHPVSAPATGADTPRRGRWLAIATGWAALCILVLHATSDVRAFWLLAVALLATSAVDEMRRGRPDANAPPAGGRAHWLWLAAGAGALIASFAHRPDADDALYLDLAVAAVAHPDWPLLAADTLHGIDGLPLLLPVYRLHSIELLQAAGARLLGARVLDMAHVVTPAVAGALVPLAFARLLRLLLPAAWGWALAAVIAFLLLGGGGIQAPGQFGFVRLQQGKAILLSVAAPAIAAYAIELARAPSPRRWLRLAASQIAALGLSASAVWVAPTIAGLAMLAAVPRLDRRALRALAGGALACAYPVAAGLSVRATTLALFDAGTARGEFPVLPDAWLARSALAPVLGPEPFASLQMAIVLLAGTLAASPASRRFASVFALGFLVLFLNPFTASAIAAGVTGPGTYWRVFWVLPLGVLVALVATAPRAGRSWPVSGPAAGTLACLVVLLTVPAHFVASTAGGVIWSRPGWRIPGEVRPLIDSLLAHTGPDATVLLPLDAAPWITGFESAPSPLVVRPDYLGVLRSRFGKHELDRRMHLARLVSGEARTARGPDALRKAIDAYALDAVGLGGPARSGTPLDATLEQAGFERVLLDPHHALWVHQRTEAAPGTSPPAPQSPRSGQSK